MTPQDKVAARLAGIDIVRVLDLDGTGSIDFDVLASALKQFDSSVFTDENVVEVMNSLGLRSQPEGKVGIKDFAKYVGAPETTSAPPMHSKLAEVRGSALDAYMDGLICNVKGFREVLAQDQNINVKTNHPQEEAALASQLSKKAKEYMMESQRKHIHPLWDQFDVDGNGVLTPSECSRLVTAYIKALVPRASEICRGSIELGVELSVVLYEKRVTNPAARQAARAHADKQINTLHAKIAPLVTETFQQMAREDASVIAAELLVSLDKDKDGKVTRGEFEEVFMEAMQQVLGPERMMKKLQKANSVA